MAEWAGFLGRRTPSDPQGYAGAPPCPRPLFKIPSCNSLCRALRTPAPRRNKGPSCRPLAPPALPFMRIKGSKTRRGDPDPPYWCTAMGVQSSGDTSYLLEGKVKATLFRAASFLYKFKNIIGCTFQYITQTFQCVDGNPFIML